MTAIGAFPATGIDLFSDQHLENPYPRGYGCPTARSPSRPAAPHARASSPSPAAPRKAPIQQHPGGEPGRPAEVLTGRPPGGSGLPWAAPREADRLADGQAHPGRSGARGGLFRGDAPAVGDDRVQVVLPRLGQTVRVRFLLEACTTTRSGEMILI